MITWMYGRVEAIRLSQQWPTAAVTRSATIERETSGPPLFGHYAW